MKWNDKLRKASSKAKEEWTTNAQVQEAWEKHVRKRGAKNTQRNLLVYTNVFFRSFEDLVTALEKEDIEAFVERIGMKCAKLINGADPQCMANMPVKACPVLLGTTPYTTCPSYQALDPVATWSYVCCINRFYEWLLEEGRIKANPCLPAMRDFASRHSALFDERRRKPRRRNLKIEEIRKLVKQSPINHGIGYMVMTKCFLRIHEALKLSWNPEHCNLEEGWMDLPASWDLGNKRKGNPRILLDSELLPWVRRYRVWWEHRVARTPDGQSITQTFLLTNFGRPWSGDNAARNFNLALHTRAIDLELMTGEETQRKDRINTHCFRAFATTYAKDRDVSPMNLQTLRGDLSPGSITRYDDYLKRLPELYRLYAPKLDL